MKIEPLEINSDTYFDIAEALYTWLCLNHKGQWSDEYRRLCQLQFKPGAGWTEQRVMNGNLYFDTIDENNNQEIFDRLLAFLMRKERDYYENKTIR